MAINLKNHGLVLDVMYKRLGHWNGDLKKITSFSRPSLLKRGSYSLNVVKVERSPFAVVLDRFG